MISIKETCELLRPLIEHDDTHSEVAFDQKFSDGISLHSFDRYYEDGREVLSQDVVSQIQCIRKTLGYPVGSDKTFSLAYCAFLYRDYMEYFDSRARQELMETALNSESPEGLPGFLFFGSARHRLALQPDTETTSLCTALLHTGGSVDKTRGYLLSVLSNASSQFLRPDASAFTPDSAAGMRFIIDLYFQDPVIFKYTDTLNKRVISHGNRADAVSLAHIIYALCLGFDRDIIQDSEDIAISSFEGTECRKSAGYILTKNIEFLCQYMTEGHFKKRPRYYVSGCALLISCSEAYLFSPDRLACWEHPLKKAVLQCLDEHETDNLVDISDLVIAADNMGISTAKSKALKQKIANERRSDGYWLARPIYSFGKLNKLSFGSVFYSSMKAGKALMEH